MSAADGSLSSADGGVGRLDRTRAALVAADLDAVLVGPGADLRHLTGYHALPLERLTMLVVRAEGDATLVVPALERARAIEGCRAEVDLVTWQETDDPIAAVVRALGPAAGGRLAVGATVWSSVTLGLQAAMPRAGWEVATAVLGPLRMRKDPEEVARLRRVAAAIDRVHAQVPSLLRAGRTEREVGRDIAALIGEEHDEVNFVIVASGPNGASPHHETGERRLEDGDAVVVDIGGRRDGYCSDMTRDYVIGAGPEGYRELHTVLEQAHAAAVAAVRPGVSAESVDRAARDVIDRAGHGADFLHRTGHGIGLEEHEAPWIVAGDRTVLEPGMAFSIEPGIYLEGRFGMRIEDIVVVTEDGAEVLNARPRTVLTDQ
jgi:Xaa-Pro aminopeptidase